MLTRMMIAAAAILAVGCGRQAGPEFKMNYGFDRYMSSEEMTDFTLKLGKAFPEKTDVIEIGRSWENRPILAIAVTDKATGKADRKPALAVVAQLRGDEKSSSAAALFFASKVLADAEKNPMLVQLLSTRALYVIPCANPDGNESGEATNSNPEGPVDLARNFEYGWSASDKDALSNGREPFSERESFAVKKFIASRSNIACAVVLSSGDDKLLYPLYTAREGFPQDKKAYDDVSAFVALLSNRNGFTSRGMLASPVAKGDESGGTAMSWLHALGIYSWDFGVYGNGKYPWKTVKGERNPSPANLVALCKRWFDPLMYAWSAVPNACLHSTEVKNGTLFVSVGNDGLVPMDLSIMLYKGDKTLYYTYEKSVSAETRKVMLPVTLQGLMGEFMLKISGVSGVTEQSESYGLNLALKYGEWEAELKVNRFEPAVIPSQMIK